jgi:phage terminase large subunit-like protein
MGLRGSNAKPLSERTLSPIRNNPWDDPKLDRVGRVITFLQELTITTGPKAFTKLELRPWQREFLEAVYTEKNGARPVRTAVLSLARKNGKTQLAAALALCHLSGPEAENRGEVYSCANDRFQASRIFDEMVAMVKNHPWLADRINISRFLKQLEDLENGSIYAALSSEAKTKMGLSPSFCVYDELGQSADRGLYDAMDSAMGGRKDPLMLVISTQAATDAAPMSQLIDYGLRICRGEIKDPAFHLTLHTAPLDADPWSIKSWRRANPALDDFRSLEDVRRHAKQARRMPSLENTFRNLFLNQRVSTEARFMDPGAWEVCAGAPNIPVGAKVYAGLDLGATRDLSALVIVYQDLEAVFHVRPYIWIPGDVHERTAVEATPYELWVKQGLLTPIGRSTDPAVIARKIQEINGHNPIINLAFDRWRIEDLKRELDAIGCKVPIEGFGQGYKDMSRAVDTVERLVDLERLRHGNHPVLGMCVANAIVTMDPAKNRKFDKSKSGGRIDALVALAMALALVNRAKPVVIDVEALIG